MTTKFLLRCHGCSEIALESDVPGYCQECRDFLFEPGPVGPAQRDSMDQIDQEILDLERFRVMYEGGAKVASQKHVIDRSGIL